MINSPLVPRVLYCTLVPRVLYCTLVPRVLYCTLVIIIIIIIIIKRGWQCKGGRERLTPYQSKDPNPTTPTQRKKEEKGKTVGDNK